MRAPISIRVANVERVFDAGAVSSHGASPRAAPWRAGCLMSTRLATCDLLGIVDAAYRIDASDQDWLEGIAAACHRALDEGFGVCAFEFENRTGINPVSLREVMVGMPDKLAEV